ncbi:MAG: hypothetical protein GWP14_06810 [Actinobacteria bacterium]|nr:hypothetical protein [Actinomycetota bacterium]
MGPIIRSLLRLQEIESQLWALRDSLTTKQRSVSAQQRKLQQMQDQVEAKAEQLKHLQSNAANQELDLKTQESAIGKLRNALNAAKNNKEYSSILSQINSDKAETSRLEERVLALLAQVDQMQIECRQAHDQIKQGQAQLDALQRASEAARAENQQRLSELESAKAEISASLPPEVVQQFERVGRNHDGQAMAAVTSMGKRQVTYSCSGCHMGITIDTVDALMSKDQIRQCPHCWRMLYIQPDES